MPVARRWVRLVGLLQAAAFITAILSLATLLDRLHRLIELFSHFRLQYLIASLILAAMFMALRRGGWSLLMIAVVAVNGWAVAPWYLGNGPQSEGATPSVTIMLANVRGHRNEPDRLIELIRSEQPDIVFLLEINDQWLHSMRQLQGIYQHSYAVSRADNFGIAVLARDPFSSVDRHDGPPAGLPSLIVRTAIAGQPLTLVSTHAMPPIGRRGFESRNRQLADIAEVVAALDDPLVLIGDLNTSMWAHHYKALVKATGLYDARDGFGVIPSWPTRLPFAMIPIDHCLVSRDLVVLDIAAGPHIGSDHLPLLVSLAL